MHIDYESSAVGADADFERQMRQASKPDTDKKSTGQTADSAAKEQ